MNQPSTPTATLKTSNSAPSSSLLARLAHYRQLKRDGPVTATATDSVPRSSTLIKSDSIDSPRYLPPSRKPAPPPPSQTGLAHLPPGSPTLNRRRLGGGGGAAAVDSPIGTKSPKFFPKALPARPVPALVDSAVDAGNNYADLLKKEREKVDFLQNYMAEVLKAKDEAELETKQLRSLLATLQHKNTDLEAEAEAAKRRTNELKVEVEAAKQHASELEADLMAARTAAVSVSSTAEEVAQLKETIRLLELERSSTQNVCQKAIQVLDAKDSSLLQKELEKLKAREQHLREANEIFQQKLHMLTEENRRLRGIKQNY